ncbi:phosphatase PAP2 family protein [Candidatus Nitrosocosmicus franklandus]|uniref:PAP2 superfamily protein (Modular protein) n=1 Tax=Candidatus Nitrosocosmicus franklandianus TaxID=1798806 RepID=A0A484I6W9_9ARCH|nr:phosphatase PAP2 family protein [Candidatus Nitrosocosmicus franklandus]VFJ12855.1 PAP2 superfamily protein (modular protein) [Candidatus Nitrosocosmicus franklandus]
MNQKKIYKDDTNPFWNIRLSVLIYFFISFVIISIIALSGITKNLDESIVNFFSSIQEPSFDLIFIIVTTTADTINLIIAGFVLTIIKRTRRFGMILLISLVAITILVTYIKPLFGVEQPQQEFVPLISLPEKFTLERDSFMPFAQAFSYPSNHIASAVAFSFIVGGISYLRSHKFAISFLIAFPMLIGFTKLYLFQHSVTDLIGGYLFGLIVVSLIVKGLKANTETMKSRKEPSQVVENDGLKGIEDVKGAEKIENIENEDEVQKVGRIIDKGSTTTADVDKKEKPQRDNKNS